MTEEFKRNAPAKKVAQYNKALEPAAVPILLLHKLENKGLEDALAVVMSTAVELKATARLDPGMTRNVLKKVLQNTCFQSSLHQMASTLPANLQPLLKTLQSLSQNLEGGLDEITENFEGVMEECKRVCAQRPDIQFPQDLIKPVDPAPSLTLIEAGRQSPIGKLVTSIADKQDGEVMTAVTELMQTGSMLRASMDPQTADAIYGAGRQSPQEGSTLMASMDPQKADDIYETGRQSPIGKLGTSIADLGMGDIVSRENPQMIHLGSASTHLGWPWKEEKAPWTILQWTATDVMAYILQQHVFGKRASGYCQAMQKEDVDGGLLLRLTQNQMLYNLQMTSKHCAMLSFRIN